MVPPKKVKRNFVISAAAAIIDCQVTLAAFTIDKKEFETLDAAFKSPFENAWQAAIDLVNDTPTDEETVDIQTGYTETLQKTMAACRNSFQDAKYFIEKAFPDRKAVWNEFGYANYNAARSSVPKMTVFMGIFHDKVVKYKTELLAAQFPPASIDAIARLYQSLIDDKKEQETVKKSRLSLTEERNIKLNAMWSFRQKVAKAAKNIYKDNYAKYQFYLLPDEKSEDNEDSSGTKTGNK